MARGESELRCKDCRYWYGAEDEGAGPCSLKHGRGERKFLTWGLHLCDEKVALKEYEEIWRQEARQAGD